MAGKKRIVKIKEGATHQENVISMRGILFFAAGMLMMVGVTFTLMAIMLFLMRESADNAENQTLHPMGTTSTIENLPAEPRLQTAPGFGVTAPNGERINLELKQPQSEYWALQKIWSEQRQNGIRDEKGQLTTLSIEEARKKFMQQQVPTRKMEDGNKVFQEARRIPSGASAGRTVDYLR